jgi:hypothetical protein
MVGTPTNVSACLAFQQGERSLTRNMLDLNTSPAALIMRNMPMANLAKGAECRESPSPPSQGKNILLTFPFIEPAGGICVFP